MQFAVSAVRVLTGDGINTNARGRSHFGSRAISCSNVHGVFPYHELYNPVLLFPTCSHGTWFLPFLPPLRIWVLLTALFLTSKEQDTVPVRWRRKSTKCSYKLRSCRYSYRAYSGSKIASKRFPGQWPRMMRKSRILNKWFGKILEYTRTERWLHCHWVSRVQWPRVI